MPSQKQTDQLYKDASSADLRIIIDGTGIRFGTVSEKTPPGNCIDREIYCADSLQDARRWLAEYKKTKATV